MNGSLSGEFWIPLAAMLAGYLTKKTGKLSAHHARPAMLFIQKNITPWVVIASFWTLDLVWREIFWIPLVGLAVIFFQILLARPAAAFMGLKGRALGSFLVGAALSNVGFFGWAINFVLFGQRGYDLAFAYGFYFIVAVYLVAYPIAGMYTDHPGLRAMSFKSRILMEGTLVRSFAAIVIGVILNASSWELPASAVEFKGKAVLGLTVALMFAAGLTVRLRAFRQHLVPGVVMCAIKSIATPAALFALMTAGWVGNVQDTALTFALLIESMTPMAISCLTVSVLFHLDQDLTNALWFMTTLFFFAALALLVPVIPRVY